MHASILISNPYNEKYKYTENNVDQAVISLLTNSSKFDQSDKRYTNS